jgi:hypothetical protein
VVDQRIVEEKRSETADQATALLRFTTLTGGLPRRLAGCHVNRRAAASAGGLARRLAGCRLGRRAAGGGRRADGIVSMRLLHVHSFILIVIVSSVPSSFA